MATTVASPVSTQDVTKVWGDSVVAALAEKLLKEGGTMTGQLIMNLGAAGQTTASIRLTSTANQVVFIEAVDDTATRMGFIGFIDPSTVLLIADDAAAGVIQLRTGATVRFTVGISTITSTLPITLPAAPTANLEAATKQYVDTLTINAQVGTSYTLALADQGKLVTLSNAGAIALAVPTNAAVAFPIGTQIQLAQLGAGRVTVSGTGVVGTPSLLFRAQYSAASLIKYGTDNWLLIGDLLIP